MQQDDSRACAITRIPNARALVVDEALLIRGRQWQRAVCLEFHQLVIRQQSSGSSSVTLFYRRRHALQFDRVK